MIPLPIGAWWFKPAVGIGIVLGFMWWLRVHDNKVRDQQRIKTEAEVRVQVLKEHEEEWKRQQEQLDAQREQIAADRQSLDASAQQLAVDRAKLRANLTAGLSDIKTELGKLPDKVAAIPSDQLTDSIRGRLGDLR